MVELARRFFKSYRESRSFSSLINIHSFADEKAFLTKGEEVGVVLSLRGRDSECLEPQTVEAVTAAFRSALRVFGERFVVQSFVFKRSNPEIERRASTSTVFQEAESNRLAMLREKANDLFTTEMFLVVMIKPKRHSPNWMDRVVAWLENPFEVLRQLLSTPGRTDALDREVEASLRTLYQAVNSFVDQTADVLDARCLSSAEAFSFLRRNLNPDTEKANSVCLSEDTSIDYLAVGSELECYRDHLRLDETFLKMLILKKLPAKTFADMFGSLSKIKASMTFVTEWTAIDPAKAIADLHSRRRHWSNLKTSLFSRLAADDQREVLVDESKEALIAEHGELVTEMEMGHCQTGYFSFTVIIYGTSLEDAERAAAEVMKIVGVHDGALNEERYNGLNAFLAALPAGHPYNLRRQVVTDANYSDMVSLFQPAEGDKRNDFLDAPSLVTLETEDQSLFDLNLHVEDVGHMLIMGPTGAGKSFALNSLIIHAQQYNPRTFIFDVGESYRWLVELLGGSYVAFRPDAHSCSINLFCLAPTPANLEFLCIFVALLVGSSGYQMNDSEGRAVFEAVQSVYLLEPAQRRLLSLSNMVPRSVGNHLKRWTGEEQYGRWFDNEVDNVSFARVQGMDFEGMEQLPVVRQPLIALLLHRADQIVRDPALSTVFKLAVVDEAWLFLKHASTKTYITNALRTWRKKNAAMILATQSLADLAGDESFRPVIESCPTKLLLANPTLDAPLYEEVLRLNPIEQQRVRQLKAKKQFLLKREGLSKVLSLNVDPRSYWLFTTNPYEAKRRQELVNQHGLKTALELLAGGKQ